jgi:hypothetical protein
MRKIWLPFTVSCLGVILVLLFACAPDIGILEGRVTDENDKPIPGAIVRIKATGIETVSDQQGHFLLTGLAPGEQVFVTAWASGYFINGVDGVLPGASDVEIVLHAHHDHDNPDYAWLPSTYHPGEGENQGCAECHSTAYTEGIQSASGSATFPVDEWLLDAHAGSALNLRFLTMYNGTDVAGHQSPATRYASSRDYGRFPLRPDPEQPYFGPGYKLDFPETDGNCAACHTPAASANNPYGVDPTTVNGVPAEGVPCDFCHKVWAVRLDSTSGLPYPNMPGVLSFEFRRPPEGHQFFAGPLDDVAPGEDTYSPLQRQSQFCASCHFGVFWDTLVYNSFGEWLESPYGDPETGKTCQDCHMPPMGAAYFARPEAGGQERDPSTIFSHRMPGAADEALLQNAVSMEVEAQIKVEQVLVNVVISNDKTGHHVPTDSPLRHMILLVNVTDSLGETLEQVDGPVVPEWGGLGDPGAGYYAGLPGTAYAKILQELWTEVTPSGAYWNPTRVVSDNRLAAFASDTSVYTFSTGAAGQLPSQPFTVQVTLLFRRAYIDLMDQKGWDMPDIVMASETIQIP